MMSDDHPIPGYSEMTLEERRATGYAANGKPLAAAMAQTAETAARLLCSHGEHSWTVRTVTGGAGWSLAACDRCGLVDLT